MPSFGRFGTALMLGGFVGLAACSSEVITLYDVNGMPPGCKESFCDVHYDWCYDDARSGSGSQCGECWSICSGSSNPSCYSSCLSACQSTGSMPSVDHCGKALQECRSTVVNRGCADGIARSSIPHPVPSEKLAFKPPPEPRKGACSEEEIEAFETDCAYTDKRCRSVGGGCLGCLLVGEGADRWGPYLRRADGFVRSNGPACIASLGDPTCAAKVFAASECHRAACPYLDPTCSELASTVSCAAEKEAAKCEDKLRADPAFSACFDAPLIDGVRRDPVPRFFCGK